MELPPLFRLAKNVSRHSTYRIRMGAVLVRNNHPISVGFNKLKFSKKWGDRWGKGIHAECDALRTSGRDRIENTTIYVYREHPDGSPALARPCTHCLTALKDFGVTTIFYSTNIYPYWSREEI